MADKQTLYFPAPAAAPVSPGWKKPTRTSTPGRPTLQRVRRCGGPRRPEHGDAGRPRRHPVELPLLQARSLPVGPVHQRG